MNPRTSRCAELTFVLLVGFICTCSKHCSRIHSAVQSVSPRARPHCESRERPDPRLHLPYSRHVLIPVRGKKEKMRRTTLHTGSRIRYFDRPPSLHLRKLLANQRRNYCAELLVRSDFPPYAVFDDSNEYVFYHGSSSLHLRLKKDNINR